MLTPGRHLVLGNIACAEGALRAGCRFFAGYPITPANEIAQYMSQELPRVGGYYVQMEDELASMAAVIGASWAGAKAMTATSGPGFSLMQENISYAYMTETPCVVVDVQRSGPSTGQATMPSQQDVYQARYGAHGDYEAVALTPWSVQEMFDLTVRAFNLAERLRMPVLLLADGMIGHMSESLIVPEEVEVVDRRRPTGPECTPFDTDDPSLIPEMPLFGEGYELLVTGSAHRPSGRRDYTPIYMERKLWRIREKVLRAEPEIRDVVEYELGDAEVAVLSYGASARPSFGAVRRARGRSLRVGMLRLRALWPFPEEVVSRLAEGVEEIVVVEMNMGKIIREVERAVCGRCRVSLVSRVGGVLPTLGEVYEAIGRAVR
ncbi:MAG: 2-oxoglutarate ferredoxin oxidoreductase subunit alpha [Candidatus Bathyarchaeota archaeon B23]|nr:MAG: 2-oxoglutarate ferredoxin oxidoreductase subunit alpha [Candidatus Bathyarchaeota archaeon B23]